MNQGALVADGGSQPINLSGRRSRIMDQLRVNLRNHPATDYVAYEPTRDGLDSKIVVDFDTDIYVDGLIEAETAHLEVTWWTHPIGTKDQFKFHYIESTGYDCGWHRQPHPERDEIPFDHFQQRADPQNEYQYQAVEFNDDHPVGLVWEIVATRLPRIIRARYGSE